MPPTRAFRSWGALHEELRGALPGDGRWVLLLDMDDTVVSLPYYGPGPAEMDRALGGRRGQRHPRRVGVHYCAGVGAASVARTVQQLHAVGPRVPSEDVVFTGTALKGPAVVRFLQEHSLLRPDTARRRQRGQPGQRGDRGGCGCGVPWVPPPALHVHWGLRSHHGLWASTFRDMSRPWALSMWGR